MEAAIKAYRRCSPVDEVLEGLALDRFDVQDEFVVRVIGDSRVQERPGPVRYRKSLLEEAVRRAEAGGEVHDALCEALFGALAAEEEDQEVGYVSLQLGPHVLSFRVADRDNEVGLRLWPAAEVFAELVLGRPDCFARRSVLELGAGVGLAGLACAVVGARVVLTDGASKALANLDHILEINMEAGVFKNDGSVTVAALDWLRPDDLDAIVRKQPLDIVVAADCVYDPLACAAFAALLRRCWDLGAKDLWLANAIRTPSTWSTCLDALHSQGLHVVDKPDVLGTLADSGGPRISSARSWEKHAASLAPSPRPFSSANPTTTTFFFRLKSAPLQ